MKNLGGYKREESSTERESARFSRRRKALEATPSSSFKIGRTFGGDVQKERSERLVRMEVRRRNKHRRALIVSIVVLLLVAVILYVLHWAYEEAEFRRQNEEPEVISYEPTVDIVDESAGNNISERVKLFVYYIENDLKDYNLTLDHVVLPLQKSHEIRIYIEGRGEYFKLTIDRETGVQAEDVSRIIKYLDSKGINCEYVDLRVEGKAYYR